LKRKLEWRFSQSLSKNKGKCESNRRSGDGGEEMSEEGMRGEERTGRKAGGVRGYQESATAEEDASQT